METDFSGKLPVGTVLEKPSTSQENDIFTSTVLLVGQFLTKTSSGTINLNHVCKCDDQNVIHMIL